MPDKYNLSQEAEDDIFDAYQWYEQQQSGLGEEFIDSLDQAKISILRNPSSYRLWYKKKVRGFLTDRFPFVILYILEKDSINVISVFNTNRNPFEWKKRLK